MKLVAQADEINRVKILNQKIEKISFTFIYV